MTWPFSSVTGDYNPYHQDESFAKESWYGSLTIPGLLTGSMLTHIGGLLGFLATEMPFEYLAPVLRRRHDHLLRHHRREERGEA